MLELLLSRDFIFRVSTYDSPIAVDRQLDLLSIADVPDGLDKILKVKVHPHFKFMDNDEENLPGGVCIVEFVRLCYIPILV